MCVLNVFLNVFLNAFINVFLNIFLNVFVLNSTSQANQPRVTTRQTIGKNIHYWICWTIVIFLLRKIGIKTKNKGPSHIVKGPKKL